jgi:hypothetical protein
MLDWAGRIDCLAHYLAGGFGVNDREATEVLLSALVACPRTSALWCVIETNWYSRECLPAWFSFGGLWVPESLPQLRALRPRKANQLICGWLDEPRRGRLFVECDYDGCVPRYRRVFESGFLLAQSLRLRVLSTPGGATCPVDERDQQQRADRLRALASDVIEDRTGARPPDPPNWKEPPDFLYYTELSQHLGGRQRDWGQLATLLRSLGVRHAHLHGRTEVDETDWLLLARVLRDHIPPWVARAVEYLFAAPDHQAEARTLARVMRLASDHYTQLTGLCQRGLFTWNESQKIWGLVPKHAPYLADVIAGRAFQAATRSTSR